MENQPQREKAQERAEWVRSLGLFTAIIVELLGCTGAGVGLGYLAWKKAGAPWWVLVLTSVAGLALAMYRMYLMSTKVFGGKDSHGS